MPNYTPNYNLVKPLQTDNYNIDIHNGNMDIIDTKLKEVETGLGVEKDNIKSVVKIKESISILTTGWTLDPVSNLNKYKITDVDITPSSIVDVNIKLVDLEKAEDFKSSNESFQGYVEIYSESVPSDMIKCDIIIQKQVI